MKIKLERNSFDDVAILLCPHCGGNNLHHRRVRVYDRYEDQPVTTETTVSEGLTATHRIPSKDSRNPSSRRDGLAIEFMCETCDVGEYGEKAKPLILTIAQHKGCTHVEWSSAFLDPPHMAVLV